MNKKRVCECGHSKFEGHQIRRYYVQVYSDGIVDVKEDDTEDCYDCETPYGPFTCLKCGKEYSELSNLPEIEE